MEMSECIQFRRSQIQMPESESPMSESPAKLNPAYMNNEHEHSSEHSDDDDFDCGSSCSSLDDRLQKMRPISCSPQLRSFDRHRFEAHNWRLLTMRAYRRLQTTVDGVQRLLGEYASNAARDSTSIAASGWITRPENAGITASFGCHAKPVLTICGAPNSGKSTLINCLLGCRVLPTRFGQDDKGLIRLVYSSRFFVRYRDLEQSGSSGASSDLAKIIRNFTHRRMTEEERQEWISLKDNCCLEIGVDCPLLQSGFSIVEVPECVREDFLLSVLNQQEHSLYQTLVFVLDGMNGISQMVREFLLRLKNQCMNLSILYVINKIDFNPEALKKDGAEPGSDSDDELDSCEEDDGDEALRRLFPKGRALEENNAKRALNILTKTLGVQGLHDLQDRAVLVSLLRWNTPLKEVSTEIVERNLLYKQRYKDLEAELDGMLRAREIGVFHLSAEMLRTASMRLYRTFTAGHRLLHPEGQLNNQEALNLLTRETKKIFSEVWQYMKDKRRCFQFTVFEVHRRERQDIIDWCVDQSMTDDGSIDGADTRERTSQLVQDLVVRRLQSRFEELLRAPLQDIRQSLLEKLSELQARICSLSYCQHTVQMLGQSVADKASHGISQLAQLTLTVQIRRRPTRLLSVVRFFRLARPATGKDSTSTGRNLVRSLAESSYDSIEVSWMTQRLFHEAEDRLRQTEATIMGIVTSRLQHNSGLQKLLARSVPEALRLWQDAQICVAAADGLANVARHGPLHLETNYEPMSSSDAGDASQFKLGPRYRLAGPYAGFAAHDLVATITSLWDHGNQPDEGCLNYDDEASLARWRSGLGGLLNHLLIADTSTNRIGATSNQHRWRYLAMSRLLTFNETGQLCSLHQPIGLPIDRLLPESVKLTDLQTCELVDGMCGAFAQLADSLPTFAWQLDFAKFKVTVSPSNSRVSVVYSLLDDPIDITCSGSPQFSTLTSSAAALIRGGRHHQLLDWALAFLLKPSVGASSPTAPEGKQEDLRNLLVELGNATSAKALAEKRERLKEMALCRGRRLAMAASALYQRTQQDDLIQELRLLVRRELSTLRSGVSKDQTRSSTSTTSGLTVPDARRSQLGRWVRFNRRMRAVRERALTWADWLDESVPSVARGDQYPPPPETLLPPSRVLCTSLLSGVDGANSGSAAVSTSLPKESKSLVLVVTACSRRLQFAAVNRLLRQRVLPPTDEFANNRQCLGVIKLDYSESQRIDLNRRDRPYYLPLRAAAGPDGRDDVDVAEQVARFIESLPDDTATAWTGLASNWLSVQVDNPVLRTGFTLLAPPEQLIRLGRYEQLQLVNPTAVLCVTEEPPTVSELHHLLSLQMNLPSLPILAIHCKSNASPVFTDSGSPLPLSSTLPSTPLSATPRLRKPRYRLSHFSISIDSEEDTISPGSIVSETQLLLDKRLDTRRIRRLVLPVSSVVGGFGNDEGSVSDASDTLNADCFDYSEEADDSSPDIRLEDAVAELLEIADKSDSERSLLRLESITSRLLECLIQPACSESSDSLAVSVDRLKARVAAEFAEASGRLENEIKASLKEHLSAELATISPLVVDECGRIQLDDQKHQHQAPTQHQQQRRLGQSHFSPGNTETKSRRDAVCRSQIEACVLSSCSVVFQRACSVLADTCSRRLAERLLPSSGGAPAVLLGALSHERLHRVLSLYISGEDFDVAPLRWQEVKPGADTCLQLSIGNDWKTLTATETLTSVDVPSSAKHILEQLSNRLQAAKMAVLDLINDKLQFCRQLQKLLAKSAPDATRLWQDAQLCAAAADALSSVAEHGALKLSDDGEQLGEDQLGPRYRLDASYAGFNGRNDFACVTVTCLWDCGNGADACGGSDVDEAAINRWRSGLGGLLNHRLLKSCFCVGNLAVTRLLTFNDRARLCAIHTPLGKSLANVLTDSKNPLTDVRACEIVDGLCGAFAQLTELLPVYTWSFDHSNLSVRVDCTKSPTMHLLFDLLHQPAINFKALASKQKRTMLKHQEASSLHCNQQHLALLDLSLLVLMTPSYMTDCQQLLGMDDVKTRRARLKNLAKADINKKAVESSFLLKRLLSFYQEKPNEVCASIAAAVRRELSYRRSCGDGSSK